MSSIHCKAIEIGESCCLMAVKNYYDGLQLVLAEFLERSKGDERGFSQVAYVVKVMPPSGELSFFTAQCDHTLQHLSRHFKGCGLSSAHLCVERSPSKDHAQDSCLWVRWVKESSHSSSEQGRCNNEVLDGYGFIMGLMISLLG